MDPAFTFHKLNSTGIERAKSIASSYDFLLMSIKRNCIEGRELSIAITKLEESCFFAKKAMAQILTNQDFGQGAEATPSDQTVNAPEPPDSEAPPLGLGE